MRSLIFLLVLVACSALGLEKSSAADKIHVALYLAENIPPPPGARVAPEGLRNQLRQVFGFRHYELKKGEDLEMHREWEQWFVPRRDFFLRLQPFHREPGEPRHIAYEIYKDGFIVARGDYWPNEDTPLFINGPDFHQGRLIFVLQSRDDD